MTKIYWHWWSNGIEDQNSSSSNNFRVRCWQLQQNSVTKMHKPLSASPVYCLLVSGSSQLKHRWGFGDLELSTTRKDQDQKWFDMNPSTRQLRDFSHKAKTYPKDFYHTQASMFLGLSSCFLPVATLEKFLLVHWWLLWNGRHREEIVPAGSWDSWGHHIG